MLKAFKFFSNFTYLFFTIILFTKCTEENKEAKQTIVYKQHTILLPDSLVIYNPFKTKIDSTEIAKSPLKIYSFIDVSCPSCLSSFKKWKSFVNQKREFNIPVILICQSEDNYELLKYLCEEKDIPELPVPFYFDTKNQFFKKNKFLNAAPNEHTVLVDENNLVLLKGDPTLSENIKKSYLDVINITN